MLMYATSTQEAEDKVWRPVRGVDNFIDMEVPEEVMAQPSLLIHLRSNAVLIVQFPQELDRIFSLEIRREEDGRLPAICLFCHSTSSEGWRRFSIA